MKGRVPGTDRWKPIGDGEEVTENAPGVLIVQIKENLDFGTLLYRGLFAVSHQCLTANTSQLKGSV